MNPEQSLLSKSQSVDCDEVESGRVCHSSVQALWGVNLWEKLKKTPAFLLWCQLSGLWQFTSALNLQNKETRSWNRKFKHIPHETHLKRWAFRLLSQGLKSQKMTNLRLHVQLSLFLFVYLHCWTTNYMTVEIIVCKAHTSKGLLLFNFKWLIRIKGFKISHWRQCLSASVCVSLPQPQ